MQLERPKGSWTNDERHDTNIFEHPPQKKPSLKIRRKILQDKKNWQTAFWNFQHFFCIEDDFALNIHGNFQWYFRSYRIYEVLTIASLAPRQCFGTSTAKKEHSTWISSSTRFAFKSWNLNCYDCLSNSCGLHFLGAIIFSENSSMYAAFLKQSGMPSMKGVFLGLGCWEDMARISFAWLVV